MIKKCVHRHRRAGFTLVELLVVLFVIIILMSILIPAIAGVRKRGYEVRTRSMVQKIASACQVYMGEWHAAPGILPDAQLYGGQGSPAGLNVTSTENLTLSLLGGLSGSAGNYTYSSNPLTTNGALSLNPSDPKRYNAYIDYVASEMDWVNGSGNYTAQFPPPMNVTGAQDSVIPEFLDGYPDPKPIIYMRAHSGGTAVIDDQTSDLAFQQGSASQYHMEDVTAYTGNPVASSQVGTPFALSFGSPAYGGMPDSKHFLSWYEVFRNDGMTQMDSSGIAISGTAEVPKGKDGFILIAAGSSRIWLGRDAIIVTN